MKKEEQAILVRRIIILIFLVMLVVGFTVPSLLDLNGNKNNLIEPRICKIDADCYLMCEGKPVTTLCSQNLCAQNSCEEKSFYAYNSTPFIFSLNINVNGKYKHLVNRTNSQDLFAKFDEDFVRVYSSGMPLRLIFEKINVILNGQCLTIDETYCTNAETELKLFVNGKATYAYENYVPQEGDKIELVYS